MTKVLKAEVKSGRYAGEIVRITNISVDELGRKRVACLFADGTRANLWAEELELIPEVKEPERPQSKTSMPFVSGAASSRTLTHTKNMGKKKTVLSVCETCGAHYNPDERRGTVGKSTQCDACAEENSDT